MRVFFQYSLSPFEKKLLLFSLLFQLLIAALPDPFPGGSVITDIDNYRDWCQGLVWYGLHGAYWGPLEPRIDYPPVVPYLYWLIGHTVHFFSQELFLNAAAMNFLIKIPAIICNILISAIILFECKSRKIVLGKTALWVLMINIPLVFDTSYWGQTDSIVCLLLLSSLLALEKQQTTKSCVLFTLACFTKPLAWPFSLLILSVSLKRVPPKKMAESLTAALFTAFLVLLPFIWTGDLYRILGDLFFRQLDTMPYISVNAHNLWWIVATTRTTWTDSSTLLMHGITYKLAASFLFMAAYLFILLKDYRQPSSSPTDTLKTGAMVAITFFMLAPHMHENHLFNFFPLAFIFMMGAPDNKSFPGWYLTLLACSTFNMAIHDPYLYGILHGFNKQFLLVFMGLRESTSKLIELVITGAFTKLNAVLGITVFIQIFWQYLRGQAIPQAKRWYLVLSLIAVSAIRIAV